MMNLADLARSFQQGGAGGGGAATQGGGYDLRQLLGSRGAPPMAKPGPIYTPEEEQDQSWRQSAFNAPGGKPFMPDQQGQMPPQMAQLGGMGMPKPGMNQMPQDIMATLQDMKARGGEGGGMLSGGGQGVMDRFNSARPMPLPRPEEGPGNSAFGQAGGMGKPAQMDKPPADLMATMRDLFQRKQDAGGMGGGMPGRGGAQTGGMGGIQDLLQRLLGGGGMGGGRMGRPMRQGASTPPIQEDLWQAN